MMSNEQKKYYVETPIIELGGVVSGWTRYYSSHRWDFGSWEETHEYAQSEFDTVEEARAFIKREVLGYYRIMEERTIISVVDSKWHEGNLICDYCEREITGEGIEATSTCGRKTIHFCDYICGLLYFDSHVIHADRLDRETLKACLERQKERRPESFEILKQAVEILMQRMEKNND